MSGVQSVHSGPRPLLLQHHWRLYRRKDREFTHTGLREDEHVEGEAEMPPKQRGLQKLKEPRMDPALEDQRQQSSADLDFKFLPSRTVRKYNSVVLSLQTCANLLQFP